MEENEINKKCRVCLIDNTTNTQTLQSLFKKQSELILKQLRNFVSIEVRIFSFLNIFNLFNYFSSTE